MSWDLKLYEPMPLPGKRKPLVTLRDAVKYMTGLPREEQNARTLATRRNAACHHRRKRWVHVFRRARRGAWTPQRRDG
jgi:hypothetical protein